MGDYGLNIVTTQNPTEDRPSEEVLEIVVPEIARDKPSWNLRAERKLTGYVKKADVPDDSDSDSDSESEDSVFGGNADVPDDSGSDSEPEDSVFTGAKQVVAVAPESDKPFDGELKHRRGSRFILDAKPSAEFSPEGCIDLI